MGNLLQVQVNIVLSILVVILYGHAYFNLSKKKRVNKIFKWLMGLIVLTLALEIFSVLLNNHNLKQFILLHRLVDMLGFIQMPIIPFLAYIFVKEWANRYQKEKIKTNYILLVPLLLNVIANFINYSTESMYYITNDNIYVRGPLYFILPCVAYLYFFYNLYFLWKHRKKFSVAEVIMFTFFFLVPAACTSIQLRIPIYLTTWNSVAIVIIVTYIFILNDQAYRDTLTGLENRLSFERYAEKLNGKKRNKLIMVYIDIDNFKSINDIFGHNEGDEAIKTFSKVLIERFTERRKKIIRIGGDEFIILIEDANKENVEKCMQNLTKHMEAYNNNGEKPYKLKFSYGMVCYEEAYENINQLLVYADKQMYEQKLSRKKA